jgi:hypothetical protein
MRTSDLRRKFGSRQARARYCVRCESIIGDDVESDGLEGSVEYHRRRDIPDHSFATAVENPRGVPAGNEKYETCCHVEYDMCPNTRSPSGAIPCSTQNR